MTSWATTASLDLAAWGEWRRVRPAELERRLAAGKAELRDRWLAGSRNPDVFYEREVGDAYIYDLTEWHAKDPEVAAWVDRVVSVAKERGARRILDFGAGIGTYSLALAEAGFSVEACDVNPELRAYMRWRASRHAVADRLVVTAAPSAGYDMVVCIDTVEHLADPVEWVRSIRSRMSSDATLLLTWAFFQLGDAYPMHLPEPTLGPFLDVLEEEFEDHGGWPRLLRTRSPGSCSF